ncbi:MAG: GGDEF domain-containing protein [Dokdonella sp.]|nr:GGDEF domain-containing protein [Dokdonella sp.]MCB1571423.1 GGDEF domain-containing protein [Xanthomonadales bacterium]MCB1574144.1 GGDEF domain-containing protein [Xanthomonadales bacterium]MCB1578944.1 GGDEF domain-containing protein [Xanthomonadales bacterium]
MWLNRIRQDFNLALVVTFGVITNVMILPFAAYRFLSGQNLAALIDLLIVACITLGAVHAYVSRRTRGASLFLAVTYSIGCVAIAYVAGAAGPLWTYAVLLSNFLLIERRRAALISACAIAAVAASPMALPELAHKAAFVGSSVVVSLFAFAFAWRTDLQRQQLENLATLDPLTGAGNRRAMAAQIDVAIAASARSRRPLGLITFDLDHFKQVNDRFGHEAGDHVLVQVASVVRRITRRNDRLFRLGGEEFALLIPDADASALREIAEKVRESLMREIQCGQTPITASFGGSVLGANESERQWRERADAAMYRAKREGRNRLIIDGASAPENHPYSSPTGMPSAHSAGDSTIDKSVSIGPDRLVC